LLAFTCATAGAQVYRQVGPDGTVTFTDQPAPGAERVRVAPAQAVRLPPAPRQDTGDTAREGEKTTVPYTAFSILSPEREEAVRANNGVVTVRLGVEPALQEGHRIAIKLDGEDGKDARMVDDLSVELVNVSRGRHSVEAAVVDEQDDALIQAGPVNFHVLRVSR
jgi:hypothetical protein